MALRDRMRTRRQSGPEEESGGQEQNIMDSRTLPLTQEPDRTAPEEDSAVERLPVDGRISVIDGVVSIIPPEDGGRWPVIRPGRNVILRVNGEAIEDKRVLGPDDTVEIIPADEEPICEIKVSISSTKMQAVASVHRQAGKRFEVSDVPESQFARITAELSEITEPPDPSVQDVMDKLAEAGVVFGIQQSAIQDLIQNQSARTVVVAEGKPPGEPVDGLIRFFFTEISEVDIDHTATRIDLYDRHAITWVQPRDVLAERVDPVPGEPGTDVLGNSIRPRNFRNPVLSIGEGVELLDEGRKAVATREGRPILDGKTIKVVPTFVVSQNADASTGHIRFSGDVVINGDVLDRVEVVSGGLVEIAGLVSHAKVMGQQGVIIQKSLIGGQVEAGGIAAECKRSLSVVNSLSLRLEDLLKAVQQLQRDPRMQQLKLTDGQLIQQLLEGKFSEIPKQIVELEECAARSLSLFQDFAALLSTLRSKLVGLGPTGITSRWELQSLLESLHNLALHLEAMQAEEADIEVKSLQNATIMASGKVTINGTGCYYSHILAGKGVKAPRGLLRGGKVVVNEGNVEFKELGGPGGVATEVVIVDGGTITADIIHPNVSISIRGETRVFRDPLRRARAFVNEEGELVV